MLLIEFFHQDSTDGEMSAQDLLKNKDKAQRVQAVRLTENIIRAYVSRAWNCGETY